jgi:hypothetical protein
VRAHGTGFRLYYVWDYVWGNNRNGSQGGGSFYFAGLASFRSVLELLIAEKLLFPGSKNKIFTTIDTVQHLVLKIH